MMMELMEAVVERENLKRAYARVMRNKGAAGIDAMPVAELGAHLKVHWPHIKEELLAGRYQPQAVRGYRSQSQMARVNVSWVFRR
jgi:RNA-directed DNA polymerase